MMEIAHRLERYRGALQLIFICGKNKALASKLRGLMIGRRAHIEGFTRDVPYFMRLADFFIGKPGPGSISEALTCGLPVIVACNSWTLPQERYNADWVQQSGFGVIVNSFRQIDRAVSEILRPGAEYRSSVARYSNSAVFEVPDILQHIIGDAESG